MYEVRVGVGIREQMIKKRINCTSKPLMAILDITPNELSSDFVGYISFCIKTGMRL